MTDRMKKNVAFWATAMLVTAALYVASFGPACWWSARQDPEGGLEFACGQWPEIAPRVYWPMAWLAAKSPGPIVNAILWYGAVGFGEGELHKIKRYQQLLREKRVDEAIVTGKHLRFSRPANPLFELMVLKAKNDKERIWRETLSAIQAGSAAGIRDGLDCF